MDEVGGMVEASKTYLVMPLNYLALALFTTLLQSLFSQGVSAAVLVVYQELISSLFISILALILDRGKRPPLTFSILCWAIFLATLQCPIGHLCFTESLRYVTVTFQSVGFNMIPIAVFVLAVFSGRERLRFRSFNGQAKLWGTLVSVAGATVMLMFSGASVPDLNPKPTTSLMAIGKTYVGGLLVGAAVLGISLSCLLMEKVASKYPAILTLSAIINAFGSLQTIIVVLCIERNPTSWKTALRGSLQLFAILYGGIVVTGLSSFGSNWCVSKKGAVFTSSFSPLLVVFCFLLQTLVLGIAAKPSSIVGAVLVVGGLYLVLWAKSRSSEKGRIEKKEQSDPFGSCNQESLLLNTT